MIPTSNSPVCFYRTRQLPKSESTAAEGDGRANPADADDADGPWPPEADAVWSEGEGWASV